MYQVLYLTNFVSWKAATAYCHRHEGTVLDWPRRTRAGMLLLALSRSWVKPSKKPHELELA